MATLIEQIAVLNSLVSAAKNEFDFKKVISTEKIVKKGDAKQTAVDIASLIGTNASLADYEKITTSECYAHTFVKALTDSDSIDFTKAEKDTLKEFAKNLNYLLHFNFDFPAVSEPKEKEKPTRTRTVNEFEAAVSSARAAYKEDPSDANKTALIEAFISALNNSSTYAPKRMTESLTKIFKEAKELISK